MFENRQHEYQIAVALPMLHDVINARSKVLNGLFNFSLFLCCSDDSNSGGGVAIDSVGSSGGAGSAHFVVWLRVSF